jgi:protein ImuB
MRLACLNVPSFPLAACYRTDPDLRGTTVVVTDGSGPRATIVACSPEAVRRGISIGLSAAQGAAIDPGLVVRPVSADAERAAQAALCDVAYSFSPRVEDASAGTVYLDIEGLTALHESENDLANGLVVGASRIGLDTSVGIASTKIAAQLAARDGGGVAVIPAYEEWHFLSPLPIQLLAPSARLQETFARWGIRTLGDLAGLPASAVATRLGPEGALLARRARGEDEHPLVPRPLPMLFEESAELEYGVESLEPFLFVIRVLLDRVTSRLAVRGLICGDLRLAFTLVNRGREERTVTVAAPSNDVKALLTLVRLHLEAKPPRAPVERIRLSAVPERLRPAQLDLYRPQGPAPAQLATTLARLSALCGADRLGAPVMPDSHRPDAYALGSFDLSAGLGVRGWGIGEKPESSRQRSPSLSSRTSGGGSEYDTARVSSPMIQESSPHPQPPTPNPCISLRILRPPRPLEVFCNRGHLDFIRLAETVNESPGSYRCNGRVVSMAGPWRVQGEWWRDDPLHRDYYDVQLSDGAVYRIFYDPPRQGWFVDGVYD